MVVVRRMRECGGAARRRERTPRVREMVDSHIRSFCVFVFPVFLWHTLLLMPSRMRFVPSFFPVSHSDPNCIFLFSHESHPC
ncbi:hypothetical protein BDZ91DRAFT_734402 [Kalaharituber pfeilii]|nr:hypothetical protein BDZ91DRAFT_734402 [Kalaharituber pfeilii]